MRNFYRGPSTHLNQWEAEAFARKLAPGPSPSPPKAAAA
jgi:hypothetical protein